MLSWTPGWVTYKWAKKEEQRVIGLIIDFFGISNLKWSWLVWFRVVENVLGLRNARWKEWTFVPVLIEYLRENRIILVQMNWISDYFNQNKIWKGKEKRSKKVSQIKGTMICKSKILNNFEKENKNKRGLIKIWVLKVSHSRSWFWWLDWKSWH